MKSLRVSPDKLEKVKRAFQSTGWTQEEFASEVDLRTRQPIGKFLKGKTVNHKVFKEICFQLNLDWQEVADLHTDNKDEIEKTLDTSAKNADFVGREDAITALNSQKLHIINKSLKIEQGIQQSEYSSISFANLNCYPPNLKNWQGRSKEIQQITDWFADSSINTLGIQGLSGIGKSWLAAKVYESEGFEAKYWADVSRKPDFRVFAQNVLSALTGEILELTKLCEIEQLINNLLKIMKQKQCLLVVDNLETLLDAERNFDRVYRDFFQQWLRCGSNSKLLLTSQIVPFIMRDSCRWLWLQGLLETDGTRLLQELGIKGSDVELKDFTRYINGHPTLLRFVAAYLGENTNIQEADQLGLKQLDQLFEEVEGEYRDQQRMRCVYLLGQHYQRLTPELQKLLLNLSVYSSPHFNRDEALVVFSQENTSHNLNKIKKALYELTNYSLLEEIYFKDEKQYQFHPLVLQYVKQKVGNHSKLLRRKVISYYESSLPDLINCETLDDLKAYFEVFYQYCELEEFNQAFYTIFSGDDYDNSIDNFLSLRGYNIVRASLYKNLLHRWQPSQPELWEFMTAITCLGDSYYWMGEYKLAIAYHQESLKIARNIGDFAMEAGCLVNIGLAYIDLENYEQALKYTREGAIRALNIEHHEFKANALNNLGIIYLEKRAYHKAIKYYKASQAIKKVFFDGQDDPGALINIGDAYRSLGENEKAIKYLKQGIGIARQFGHRRFEANGWFNLGLALQELGEILKAKDAWKKARELYEAMKLDVNVQRTDDEIEGLS
ncbi:tetratricopeptide repeat protein [Nostoc cycadae]|nr:tetratricopeptide repeat protein [Nostoc cycadae]